MIFIICPLWRPRGISQLVSGLYYVTRDTGCNIHIGAKLYSLVRAKVFSSVAINFGLKTINAFLRVQSFLHSEIFCTYENNPKSTWFLLFDVIKWCRRFVSRVMFSEVCSTMWELAGARYTGTRLYALCVQIGTGETSVREISHCWHTSGQMIQAVKE